MPRKTIVDADQVAESQLILREVEVSGVNELDVVYHNSSVYVPAIAGGLATCSTLGIAYNVSGGTANVSTSGLMSGFTSLTPGSIYYLSDSAAGQITKNAPAYKIPVGIAISATELMIMQGGWINQVPGELWNATGGPNGFPNRTDSVISFDSGTLKFTIQPSSSEFSYYVDGERFDKTSADDVYITDTDGLWFFYYNGSVLSSTQTFETALILDYALVALLYWDSTLGDYIYFGDERHGTIMPSMVHLWAHTTLGSLWNATQPAGLALVNFTIGDGDTDSHAQLGVNDGSFWDEDILHSIVNGSPQTLRTVAQIPVFYYEDSRWKLKSANNFSVIYNGSVAGYSGTRIAYNDVSGTGSLVQAGNNDYVLMHYFATNDVDNPVVAFCGQNVYSGIAQAREGAKSELRTLVSGAIPLVEAIAVGSVVFQTGGSYANTPKARVVYADDDNSEYIDWRSNSFNPAVGVSGGATPIPNTIVVAPEGGDYDSLANAVTAATAKSPSGTNPVSIIVHPGFYTEPAMTVPSFVNIVAVAPVGSAIISAETSTQTTFTLGTNTTITGLLITGANGAGGTGVKATTGSNNTILKELLFIDCERAIDVSGSGAPLSASATILNCVFSRAPTQTMDTAIKVSAGALAIMLGINISGTPASLIGTGVDTNGAITQGASISINYCTAGWNTYGGSDGTVGSVNVRSCTTAATVGASTRQLFQSCTIDNCTNDLVLDAGATGQFTGTLNVTKSDIDDATDFFLSINSEVDGEEGLKLVGNLGVGRHERPSRADFGSGGATTEREFCYTNTNLEAGTWNDITDEVVSASGSTFNFFAGTGAGNCIYLGAQHPYYGLRIESISTALALGTGAVVPEYWNGSAWVSMKIMETQNGTSYANQALQHTGDVDIRFGDTTGWTAKILNGSASLYWARYRITADITTIPVAERMLHYDNCTIIDEEGIVEFFGNAEIKREFGLKPMFDLQGFAATPHYVDVGANTNLFIDNTNRDNNKKDGAGSTISIPDGLDTSKPITFRVRWAVEGTATGDVENEMYFAKIAIGQVLDGTGTEQSQSYITTVSTASDNVVWEDLFQFDVETALVDDVFIWSLIRDATNGNPDDTLSAPTYIVSVTLDGTFWR